MLQVLHHLVPNLEIEIENCLIKVILEVLGKFAGKSGLGNVFFVGYFMGTICQVLEEGPNWSETPFGCNFYKNSFRCNF